MSKNLVIVESPAKAKTIEGFLGKDYLVKSSFGHIRDLSKSKLGVDIDNDFAPMYEIPADKKSVVAELKKLAKQAESIWLATDEDREGEAISWHLVESLNLDADKCKRIVFHEITKNAIQKAIAEPRKIDQNLVNAQQARRVLDRLVGFELSPLLWRKIKPSLSAGRVQSVAVRLIVEREMEINDFKSTAAFRISAIFSVTHNGSVATIKAELNQRFKEKAEALAFLEKCKNAVFTVDLVETKPARKSPAAPFTTSTLQQEASRKLGFSVSRTMTVAQKLYESGKITYMRTDSVNLSESALGMARDVIEKSFGKEYSKTRQYKSKTKGAQEAHEAIRPTSLSLNAAGEDESEKKLYELIWKRTLASQMSDALIEKTTVNINVSTTKEKFTAIGEVLKFDGFLKVYHESTDDEDDESYDIILPPIKMGQILNVNEIVAQERFSKHLPRYTEASLVKKLEELGIGRPSTYAPTISTIQKREYVIKESREGEKREYDYLVLKNGSITQTKRSEISGTEKNKLFPTDIGILVTSFLVEYFKDILDYNFTANVEKEFDDIARGLKIWTKVIRELYTPFHEKVQDTLQKSERVTGERNLGVDPKSGKDVIARMGRFGPMVQIGNTESDEKPVFAGLRKDQSLHTITLEDALELFKLPRSVGVYAEKEIVAAIGRFGPYLRYDSAFYSLPKGEDPLVIVLERAIEIIQDKKEKEKQKVIKAFPENDQFKILKGRWGAYLLANGKNYKLPKGKDPALFTLKECETLAKEATSSGKTRKTIKKPTTKKTK